MFGSYRTEGDRLICAVKKTPERMFSGNMNRFRRRKAAAGYVFEVPEQDFVFVSLPKTISLLVLS